MSYFAALAARGNPAAVVSSSVRSGSPFSALDQRLGLSSGLPSLAAGDATTDPFDAAGLSAPLGSASFFTPASQPGLGPTFAASTASHTARETPFEPVYASQSTPRASLERAPLESTLTVPLPSAAPTSARTRAESLHAELGPAVFEPRITTRSPSAQEVQPARSAVRAEPLIPGLAQTHEPPTPASQGERATEPVSREPSFPAPLRDALERVEAWMRRDAKPRAEPVPRAEPARHEQLERLRPAQPERALRAAEGRMPQRELAAPPARLSIGHIEVEVITAAAQTPAPVIWHAPPGSAARSPLAAPTGRLSFGSRQG